MHEDNSGDFSDELDEFEHSAEETNVKRKNETVYQNKPYDEGYEMSQDFSMADSFDAREKMETKEKPINKLQNDKWDEAIDISQSIDQSAILASAKKGGRDDMQMKGDDGDKMSGYGNDMSKIQPSKSVSVKDNKFDEALEFSQSGSDESVDTVHSASRKHHHGAKAPSTAPQQFAQAGKQVPAALQSKANPAKPQHHRDKEESSSEEEEDDEGDEEEEEGEEGTSYEQIEGAYNAKQYINLNVSTEVKELFQYIERFKPQEVELATALKCFIPDYLPAIGEIDGFVKVPRPDGRDDELGLKILDEPAAQQSDPIILELQFRALSKKLQVGDVAVRSIENASKNPEAIDSWISSIAENHRIRPPPQVHFKKPMPDIETLMDVWPEEFESFLESAGGAALPSPDLDMSLAEYAKTLCSILDIPTYDNPVESLHVMFSLFMDFRNNPHFQPRGVDKDPPKYGEQEGERDGADIYEMN